MNALIVVAAVSAIIATLVLPVLQIAGTSMEPSLNDGDIVLLAKTEAKYTLILLPSDNLYKAFLFFLPSSTFISSRSFMNLSLSKSSKAQLIEEIISFIVQLGGNKP